LLTPAAFNIEVAVCRNEWKETSIVWRAAERPFLPFIVYGSANPASISMSLNWFDNVPVCLIAAERGKIGAFGSSLAGNVQRV
jgi:hypothetical protein